MYRIKIPDRVIVALAWSPSGESLAIATYRNIIIWSAVAENIAASYEDSSRPIRAIAWSPSEQYITAGATVWHLKEE